MKKLQGMVRRGERVVFGNLDILEGELAVTLAAFKLLDDIPTIDAVEITLHYSKVHEQQPATRTWKVDREFLQSLSNFQRMRMGLQHAPENECLQSWGACLHKHI